MTKRAMIAGVALVALLSGCASMSPQGVIDAGREIAGTRLSSLFENFSNQRRGR